MQHPSYSQTLLLEEMGATRMLQHAYPSFPRAKVLAILDPSWFTGPMPTMQACLLLHFHHWSCRGPTPDDLEAIVDMVQLLDPPSPTSLVDH